MPEQFRANQSSRSHLPLTDQIRPGTTLCTAPNRRLKQEGSDTTEGNRVGYTSNKSKFLPRSSQEPLQVINHGARITSRRAVQRKTVDVAHRCRVVVLLLLLAIPRTAPHGSHERVVQAPQVWRLQGIHTCRDETPRSGCYHRWRGWGGESAAARVCTSLTPLCCPLLSYI